MMTGDCLSSCREGWVGGVTNFDNDLPSLGVDSNNFGDYSPWVFPKVVGEEVTWSRQFFL